MILRSFDVAVIGGGIVGTSAAAYLAEAGMSVILLERAELAAGASGRNSGAIQHPFDRPFADLHHDSLPLYRSLVEDGFELTAEPAGLLMVSFDEDAVELAAAEYGREWPELEPEVIGAGELVRREPSVHPDLAACRLATAYPVAPAAATLAFARRAKRAGVDVKTGTDARLRIQGDSANGVDIGDGAAIDCAQVLVAAGPWSPALIPGWERQPPIRSVWGVVVATSLPDQPSHVLEELGIGSDAAREGRLFSLVTVGGLSSVGSTFLPSQPDVSTLATEIVDRGAQFVPLLDSAPINAIRSCARPVSFDGRPLIGRIPTLANVFVCAGHGPWGISTGPASAALIVRQMLGRGSERADFSPMRIANYGI